MSISFLQRMYPYFTGPQSGECAIEKEAIELETKINTVPLEILTKVCQYLTDDELSCLSQVNKQFNACIPSLIKEYARLLPSFQAIYQRRYIVTESSDRMQSSVSLNQLQDRVGNYSLEVIDNQLFFYKYTQNNQKHIQLHELNSYLNKKNSEITHVSLSPNDLSIDVEIRYKKYIFSQRFLDSIFMQDDGKLIPTYRYLRVSWIPSASQPIAERAHDSRLSQMLVIFQRSIRNTSIFKTMIPVFVRVAKYALASIALMQSLDCIQGVMEAEDSDVLYKCASRIVSGSSLTVSTLTAGCLVVTFPCLIIQTFKERQRLRQELLLYRK